MESSYRLQAAFRTFMATVREVQGGALDRIGNNDVAALLADACTTINPDDELASNASEALAEVFERIALSY